MKANFDKKKKILAQHLKSAPFTKFTDQISFLLGVCLTIFQAYMLGRHPNDIYYDYHCLLIPIFLFGKWVYYKMNGWHYFMTDLCYQVNAALIIYLQFASKNDKFFKSMFFMANGCLAMSVGMFRN